MHDFSNYKNSRDFYIDYAKEMPGLISENVQEIIQGIENNKYDLELVEKFADRYVEKQENCTYDMAKFVINLMDN